MGALFSAFVVERRRREVRAGVVPDASAQCMACGVFGVVTEDNVPVLGALWSFATTGCVRWCRCWCWFPVCMPADSATGKSGGFS